MKLTRLLPLALAALMILPSAAGARQPASLWQVYSYGAEPNDVAMIYGARLDGGQPYYPGITCPNRGQMRIHFFLTSRYFPNRMNNDTMVDARGLPGPWHTTVHVTSGPVAADLPGMIEYDDIGEVIEVSAVLPHGAPITQRFLRSGAIQFAANGYRTAFPPVPDRLRARLAGYCTGR